MNIIAELQRLGASKGVVKDAARYLTAIERDARDVEKCREIFGDYNDSQEMLMQMFDYLPNSDVGVFDSFEKESLTVKGLVSVISLRYGTLLERISRTSPDDPVIKELKSNEMFDKIVEGPMIKLSFDLL